MFTGLKAEIHSRKISASSFEVIPGLSNWKEFLTA
jgi:hypothetical protein